MKVTHLVRQFHPSLGGLEDFVSNLATLQREHDVEVDIVTLNRNFQTGENLPAHDCWHGINVFRVPYIGSSRYPLAPAVLRHLRAADILHVHAIDFFVDYLAVLKRVRMLMQPVVVSTHGGIFHTENNLGLKRLFFKTVSKASLRQVERVVCCSVGDLAMFSTIRKELDLVENGIVLKKFGEAEAGIEGDALLYVGRLSENKNLLHLMEQIDIANDAGLSKRLFIVGRSSSGDANALVQMHARLRHPQFVELHIDREDADIRRCIRASRYVTSASRHEGFGLAIPELMSYGLVPVVNDIPPFRRFVEQAGCGLLFDTGNQFNADSQSLANRLADLPGDRQWRRQSQLAQRYAVGLQWDVVQNRFMDIYHALLA